jgi:outer membrane protein
MLTAMAHRLTGIRTRIHIRARYSAAPAEGSRRSAGGIALALASAALVAGTANQGVCETLADAIVEAYESNPTIEAQRSQQQIIDESYIQARAGWRPTIGLQASAGLSRAPQSDPFFGTQSVTSNAGSVAVTLSQPLYTGGRTLEAVRAAKSDILAGRQALRSAEASVLASVIGDYLSVVCDIKIVGIRQRDVAAFEGQLAETQARFKIGDVTRTDVAQIEAQLASARQSLALAQSQLQADRADYTTLVGQTPGTLVEPASLPGLPKTIDDAFQTAEENNPDLARAQLAEAASSARIAEARAARRPEVAVQGSAGYIGALVPFQTRAYFSEFTVQAIVSQPLYSGGQINSAVQQAISQNSIDRIAIDQARRLMIQAVAQSWNAWLTANANIVNAEAGATAARAAWEGARIEYRSGLRTTLDVLLAEEALSNADLALAEASRDSTTAQAALLSAEGKLQAAALVNGLRGYDPAVSLRARERFSTLPWEGVFEAIDHIGAPPEANRSIPPKAPPVTTPATLEPPSSSPPDSTPLVTTWPTPAADR